MNDKIQLIEVPKWGLSMTEGTITRWLVKEGEEFDVGAELVELESSKIVNVLEAHFKGVMRRILGAEGETLEVGIPIGIAADVSVTDAEIDEFLKGVSTPSAEQVDAAPAPAAASVEKASPGSNTKKSETVAQNNGVANSCHTGSSTGANVVPDSLQQGGNDDHVHATIHARKLAEELGVNLNNVTPSGRNARVSKQDIENTIKAEGGSVISRAVSRDAGSKHSTQDDRHVKATPVARRLAGELGINLNDCRASGARGRVSKADVEAVNNLNSQSSSSEAVAATGACDREIVQHNPSDVVTLDGMRKTIASRLQESKQNAPHFRLVVDVNIDNILSLRKKINATDTMAAVSINDILIKVVGNTLAKMPECNVQFDGEKITRFKHADIAVAVDLGNGLITPIVRTANSKGLVSISTEMRNLITKAKAGTLKPDEFRGGTFTISNLGMFGIKQFDAIINPPQVAILAVGGGEPRAVVENGQLTVATMMSLNLCCDHRVIDGATGARFLQTLKQLLEEPALAIA